MAKIGLKNFYYATATEAADGKITYGTATKLAKAISATFEPTVSDATLYADDAVAERDAGVTGGTLTLGIDRFDVETAAALLGHTTDKDKGVLISNVTDVAPYCGVGRVVTLMQDGVYKYRAVFFPKVKFQEPSSDNQTKGESTEFGTYEISGTVVPTTSGEWRKEEIFDTEAAAVAFLMTCMGNKEGN